MDIQGVLLISAAIAATIDNKNIAKEAQEEKSGEEDDTTEGPIDAKVSYKIILLLKFLYVKCFYLGFERNLYCHCECYKTFT